VLSVVRRRGDWLAVLAPELRNGEVGWIETQRVARIDCVRWSLHVDLSRRRVYVRQGGHTVRSFKVAIGGKHHPTPKGRFAVTDKLKVTDKGSPYGCCVLALTGHQNKLPQDWPGGDRLAVHATTDLSSIGKPVSLGCMRSKPATVRWLIKKIPLGSPIFIRS
jgi:lipoprotein-anchoring transpeptidase ErfK/SrfK